MKFKIKIEINKKIESKQILNFCWNNLNKKIRTK